jgi:hypothetical protein
VRQYARLGLQIDLQCGRKPARTSSEKSCGCSQAAKCPPLSIVELLGCSQCVRAAMKRFSEGNCSPLWGKRSRPALPRGRSPSGLKAVHFPPFAVVRLPIIGLDRSDGAASAPVGLVLEPQASSLKPQASSLKPQASSLKPQASSLKPQARIKGVHVLTLPLLRRHRSDRRGPQSRGLWRIVMRCRFGVGGFERAELGAGGSRAVRRCSPISAATP